MKAIYWVGVFLAFTLSAGAQGVPESFNYQGVLRDGSGDYLAAGTYNVTFRLYATPTGNPATALWGREYAVLLDTNGLFNVELTDAVGTPIILDTNLPAVITEHEALYLGLTVQGSTEIAPRQQLLSVPFAIRAGDVEKASGNFTVHGVLHAMDGLEVDGTIQATTSLQVGTAGSGVATLRSDATGALKVPDLHVGGSATVAHNLDVAGNATLTNLAVNGTSSFAGAVSAFSRNLPDAPSFAVLSKTVPRELLARASSDGFIIINLMYSIITDGAGDMNEVYSEIKFTGREQDRTVWHGIRIHDMDARWFTKKDSITLPVLKGETVVLHPSGTDGWDIESDTKIQFRSIFVPFGMNH